MKQKIITVTYICIVTLIALLSVDLVSDYFDLRNKQLPEYKDLSEELQLKSEPENVLYIQEYVKSNGEQEVKYAYANEEAPTEEWEDISRRTPNSQTRIVNTEYSDSRKIETLHTTFSILPRFYNDGGEWKQIEYATTTPEIMAMSGAYKYVKRRELWERLLPGKPVFALTAGPFNPDAHAETTSVDGEVSYTHPTWATVRGAATGDALSDDQSDMNISCNTGYDIFRGFLLFDTSSLPDSIIVQSATTSILVRSVRDFDNDAEGVIHLVSSSPALNTALTLADFDQVGSVDFATPVDLTSLQFFTNQYYPIVLNSSGREAISTTGITKFGLREGHDFSNTPCVAENLLRMRQADSAPTDEPKLDVTYTISTFSMGQWFPF